MNSIVVWLAALLVCSLAVFAFRRLSMRSLQASREPVELEMYRSRFADDSDFLAFCDTVLALSSSYSVDSRRVSPDDLLSSYSKIDSWSLGEGDDSFARWLAEQGIVSVPSTEITIVELARQVRAARDH